MAVQRLARAIHGIGMRLANPQRMLAIASLLLVVSLSMLVTRIAAVALSHTGLSEESARFQARSAFTGAGFTTSESERVVDHPVRRRIVQLLMLLGNAGLVTAASTLVLSFLGQEDGTSGLSILIALGAGLALLFGVTRSSWVDRRLNRWIDWALAKYTDLDVRDYQSLLRLQGDYQLVDLLVQPDSWFADRSLSDLALRDEGLVVLGVARADGEYLGIPKGETVLTSGSTVYLYGRADALARIDERSRGRTGHREHVEACAEQTEIEVAERAAASE